MSRTVKPMLEHQRVHNLIWSQMPEMQKRTSSSWWFFILFPKGAEGYGPRQMMFSIAARVGERVRINDVWLPGIDLKRPIVDGEDRFPAMSVGWYCDGQTVHEDIVKVAAQTELSEQRGLVRCWSEDEDEGYGIEMCRSAARPLGLAARVRGQLGTADFRAWGDLDSLHSSPHESINFDTPLAGTHFVAWRRMHFEGQFDLPVTGKEHLEGICYFQRVCLNVPTFPWKWIWALFPNGDMFSAYIPYAGLNLLRKGYKFFDSNRREQATISFAAAGFWDRPGPEEQILFNRAEITPILGEGPHPDFEVKVSNNEGDHVAFLAAPYGHTRFYIDHPVLGGRLETHWSYNEYMFRMQNLNGSVSGRPINHETMGQGFGTLEYTWGLGL